MLFGKWIFQASKIGNIFKYYLLLIHAPTPRFIIFTSYIWLLWSLHVVSFLFFGGEGFFLEGKVGTSKWIESPETGVLGCNIFFKAGIRNIRSWVGKFPRCTPGVILSRYHQDFKLCFGEKWMIEFHCSYSIFSRACLLVQDCVKCYRWGLRALLRCGKVDWLLDMNA